MRLRAASRLLSSMPNWSSLRRTRTSLAARVQSVEDAASLLAEHGDNAAEGLEGVRQAQADLDAARDGV